jgi:hypothetical protein
VCVRAGSGGREGGGGGGWLLSSPLDHPGKDYSSSSFFGILSLAEQAGAAPDHHRRHSSKIYIEIIILTIVSRDWFTPPRETDTARCNIPEREEGRRRRGRRRGEGREGGRGQRSPRPQGSPNKVPLFAPRLENLLLSCCCCCSCCCCYCCYE